MGLVAGTGNLQCPMSWCFKMWRANTSLISRRLYIRAWLLARLIFYRRSLTSTKRIRDPSLLTILERRLNRFVRCNLRLHIQAFITPLICRVSVVSIVPIEIYRYLHLAGLFSNGSLSLLFTVRKFVMPLLTNLGHRPWSEKRLSI